MFDVSQSLLPKSATDLARAMDILEERLFQLPVSMVTKNPQTVSEALLDHLAWENSVDVWDISWPAEIKRSLIAVSAEVHRHKGTPYGVKKALSVFGVGIDLVEWWMPEGSGVPGTFLVRAFLTDNVDADAELGATGQFIRAIEAVLNRVAPVSRGWALEIGVRAQGVVFLGLYTVTEITAIAPPLLPDPPELRAGFAVIAAPYTQIKSTISTK